MGMDRYKSWDIEPASVSGNDMETQYGAFIELEEPLVSGLHSVPGVTLETDAGGHLEAAVEFHGVNPETEEEEKLGEAYIAELQASEPVEPATYTDYGVQEDTVSVPSQDATGTFYSAWKTCTIPECTRAIIMSGGASLYGGPQPNYASFVAALSVEFGDAGENVIGSVDLLHGSLDGSVDSGSGDCQTGQPFTMGAVSKARLKLVVTSSSNTWVSGLLGLLTVRRFG